MRFTPISSLTLASLCLSVNGARTQIPLGVPQSAALTPHALLATQASALGLNIGTKVAALPASHAQQLVEHIQSLRDDTTVNVLLESGEVVTMAITEGEKAFLTLGGWRFVDVTPLPGHTSSAADVQMARSDYPQKLQHKSKDLAALFDTISIPRMTAFLTEFSGFFTRYYRSQNGRDSQLWLLKTLKQLHADLNPKAPVTFREFDHAWAQKSIIVRLEPPKSKKEAVQHPEIVIMGAHLDSTGPMPFLRAPGADDDGSGVTVLLSAFTALLNASYVPLSSSTAVELHFYSGEEGGLLGSKEVAAAYKREGKNVRSMFHMDVTAFVKQGTKEAIGVIEDNVNEELTTYMKLLINEFAEIPVASTKCGYGCSDHASWHAQGFPAAIISEGKFEDSNTHMHSAQDTIDLPEFSFAHVAQFVRVAIGYAVELGQMGHA